MDTFDVRKRVPNVEEDGGSYEPPFLNGLRCPNCAQHLAIRVETDTKNMLFVLRYGEYEKAVKDEIDFVEDDMPSFLEALDKVETEPLSFERANSNVNVTCPYCGNKTEGDTAWKDAFDNPYNYFEYDVLCDKCGGEVFPNLIRNKETDEVREVMMCERCGEIRGKDDGRKQSGETHKDS